MSDEEKGDLEQGIKEREEKYTEAKLRELLKDVLDRVPEKHGEALLRVISRQKAALAEDNYDCRHGCSLFVVDCLIPKHFSRHIQPFNISEHQRLLYARLQGALVRNQVAVPGGPGVASHPFLLVKRPGAKIPSDADILLSQTDEQLLRMYRVVFDNSSLSSEVLRTGGDLPSMVSCFTKLGKNSGRSLIDLKQSFYQIAITRKTSSLFGFESQIKGIPWLQLVKLSQGFSESSRLLILVMNVVATKLDLIPFSLPFEEARAQIDLIH